MSRKSDTSIIAVSKDSNPLHLLLVMRDESVLALDIPLPLFPQKRS